MKSLVKYHPRRQEKNAACPLKTVIRNAFMPLLSQEGYWPPSWHCPILPTSSTSLTVTRSGVIHTQGSVAAGLLPPRMLAYKLSVGEGGALQAWGGDATYTALAPAGGPYQHSGQECPVHKSKERNKLTLNSRGNSAHSQATEDCELTANSPPRLSKPESHENGM